MGLSANGSMGLGGHGEGFEVQNDGEMVRHPGEGAKVNGGRTQSQEMDNMDQPQLKEFMGIRDADTIEKQDTHVGSQESGGPIAEDGEVELIDDPDWSAENQTFGQTDDEGNITVQIAGRHPMDVLRTIAHELSHVVNGHTDGEDGSDDENEANAQAGEMMRQLGKEDPELFLQELFLRLVEGEDVDESLTAWGKKLGKWGRGALLAGSLFTTNAAAGGGQTSDIAMKPTSGVAQAMDRNYKQTPTTQLGHQHHIGDADVEDIDPNKVDPTMDTQSGEQLDQAYSTQGNNSPFSKKVEESGADMEYTDHRKSMKAAGLSTRQSKKLSRGIAADHRKEDPNYYRKGKGMHEMKYTLKEFFMHEMATYKAVPGGWQDEKGAVSKTVPGSGFQYGTGDTTWTGDDATREWNARHPARASHRAKPSLEQAAGKFLVLSQFINVPDDANWDDITPEQWSKMEAGLYDQKNVQWGHITYEVQPDGSLVRVGADIDSSG